MKFETWLEDIKSNEIWYEQLMMHQKGKDFKKAALLVFQEATADLEIFARVPISEHRKHIGNKLAKMPVEYSKVIQTHQETKEEQKEQAPPLTGEARDKKIAEWLETIKKADANFRVTRAMSLTKEQIEEEGQIREARKVLKYVPPPDEEIILKNNIDLIRKEKYKGRKDPWNFQMFDVEGFRFMAESLEDAREIFLEAKSIQ